MLEGRDPSLNFIHIGASQLLETTTEKVSNTTKALVRCKNMELGSHVGWPFNWKLYNNRALAESYYLSLSAVIQTAVDPQHIQGLKKTRKYFTSAGRSHTTHIHKRIARHEHKQVVQVQNTTPTSCHEQRLDKNWIGLTAKIHIQQCLMPQLLRSNVLPHEVQLLPVFWRFKLETSSQQAWSNKCLQVLELAIFAHYIHASLGLVSFTHPSMVGFASNFLHHQMMPNNPHPDRHLKVHKNLDIMTENSEPSPLN